MTFTFGGALNSWEAKEDVKIAHIGEKLSWHKVSTHFVVGHGVCAAFKGIFGQYTHKPHIHSKALLLSFQNNISYAT
jgi:hypothetical protein